MLRLRQLFSRFVVLSCLTLTASCTPTFNWREVHSNAIPLLMLFPCKPSSEQRLVTLGSAAAAKLPMTQQACTAGGASFALNLVDAGQAENAAQVLAVLSGAQMANISGTLISQAPAAIAGSQRQTITGKWPDGSQLQHHVVQFTYGHWAVRATVMGSALEPEVVDAFFAGLRLQKPVP
jgi:hypothetical protein